MNPVLCYNNAVYLRLKVIGLCPGKRRFISKLLKIEQTKK